MKPTKRWLRMAEVYKRFTGRESGLVDQSDLDFSDEAAAEMFEFETTGRGDLRTGVFGKLRRLGEPVEKTNGYAFGKHRMDLTVEMWREDLPRGLLSVQELIADGYPPWFLRRVLPAHYRPFIEADEFDEEMRDISLSHQAACLLEDLVATVVFAALSKMPYREDASRVERLEKASSERTVPKTVAGLGNI